MMQWNGWREGCNRLGSNPKPSKSKASIKEKRKLIQE